MLEEAEDIAAGKGELVLIHLILDLLEKIAVDSVGKFKSYRADANLVLKGYFSLVTSICKEYDCMGKMNHAEKERKLSGNEERFIEFLLKSGYLVDPKIENPKYRNKNRETNKLTYHNTKLMLEHYRDLVWAMKCIPDELKAELDMPMGDLDDLIDRLDLEMSMENLRAQSRIQAIMKSRLLLDRMNEAISFLRTKPKEGERLYQIIYITYLSEEDMGILDVIAELGLSKGMYYELRKKAITLIGLKLWSAPDANFEAWMEMLSFLDG